MSSYLPPTLATQVNHRRSHIRTGGETGSNGPPSNSGRNSPVWTNRQEQPLCNGKAQVHRGGSAIPSTKRKTKIESGSGSVSGSRTTARNVNTSMSQTPIDPHRSSTSSSVTPSSAHTSSISIQRAASRYLGDDNNCELTVEAHRAAVSPMRGNNRQTSYHDSEKEKAEQNIERRKEQRGRSAGRKTLFDREKSENHILEKKRHEHFDKKATFDSRDSQRRSRSTTRFRKKEEPSKSFQSLRLKCKRGQEIRLVVIDERMTFENLQRRLDADYGFPVTLRYEDDEGDKIILSSENDLRELIRHQCGTVVVHIEPKPGSHNTFSDALMEPTPSNPATQLDPIVCQQTSTAQFSAQVSTSESANHTTVSHDRHKLLHPIAAKQNDVTENNNVSLSTNASRREQSPPKHNSIRWQRGEVLGAGAFGTVYLGLRTDTGQLMAVKQLCRDEVSAKELAVLENEIEMLKDLQHANIVQYIGTERKEDSLCIFLEYVPGGSLKRLLNRFGPLEEGVVRLYTRQILRGLEYLHSNGIAHRDIKGGNVLVGNNGIVKLADFGASKRLSQLSVIDTSSSLNGTGARGMKGTPLWMAPEVARSEKTTAKGWKKADIWSVACTVIEMLTANPPWPDCGDPMVALYQLAYENQAPPLPDDMSPIARDFFNQCFRSDPDRRPDVTSLLLHPFVSQIPSNIVAMASDVNSGIGYPVRPSTADNKPPPSRTEAFGNIAWQQKEQAPMYSKNDVSRRAASAIISNTQHNKENLSKQRRNQRGGTAIGIQNPSTTKAAQVMSDFDFTPVEIDPDVEESTTIKKSSRAASAGPRTTAMQNKGTADANQGGKTLKSGKKRVQSARIGIANPSIDEDSLDEVSIQQIDDSAENSLMSESNDETEDRGPLETYTKRAVEQAVENFHINRQDSTGETEESQAQEVTVTAQQQQRGNWVSQPPSSPLVASSGKVSFQSEEQKDKVSRLRTASASSENLLDHVGQGSRIPVPSRLIKNNSLRQQEGSLAEGLSSMPFTQPSIDTSNLQQSTSGTSPKSLLHEQCSADSGELPRLPNRKHS